MKFNFLTFLLLKHLNFRKSARKAKLLQESYDAHQLSRRLVELDKWLDHVEHSLSTNDHGEDIQSVEILIEKHNQLLAEINAKSSTVEDAVKKANHLKKKVYFKIKFFKQFFRVMKMLMNKSNRLTQFINDLRVLKSPDKYAQKI